MSFTAIPLSMPQTIPSLIPMYRTTSRIVIIFRRSHNHPREDLCVVASRNDVREHSVQRTLAFLEAFQLHCFDTQHGPMHTNSKFVNNAIDLTAMNHLPAPALRASMARGRRRQMQIKNFFFSPKGQCFTASNTNCFIQFLSDQLVSPDETDLHTIHQTEMAPFREPRIANNFDPRTSFCEEPGKEETEGSGKRLHRKENGSR